MQAAPPPLPTTRASPPSPTDITTPSFGTTSTPSPRRRWTDNSTSRARPPARFPTLADAAAAGYRPAGPYGPGAGIHYIGGTGGKVTEDGSLTDEALVESLGHCSSTVRDPT